LTATLAATALGAAVVLSSHPERLIAAATLVGILIAVASVNPRTAIILTFAFLPVMALLRRALIPVDDWTSHDPILLIAPAVGAFLAVRLFALDQRPLFDDWLSKLVAALLAVAALEVLNPKGGGLAVGAGGLLLIGMPLVWFFVGRELVDRSLALALLGLTGAIAVAVAVYGLWQTQVGFTAWDTDWLNSVSQANGGLGALRIGDSIRPFGTLASPSEYLLLLGVGVVVCVAFAPRLRYLTLAALPILGAALFLGSGRSALLLAALAVVVMICLQLFRGRIIVPIGLAVLVTIGGLLLVRPVLNHTASDSNNSLVAHQAAGLGNPLTESDSTLVVHARAFRTGVEDGVTHPLGLGTGSTTAAADRLGGDSQQNRIQVHHNGWVENIRGTDIDVSNAFLALGIVGGVLYVVIVAAIAIRLLRGYATTRDPALLAMIGIGIALLGQWLTPGHYLLSSLFWLLLGWATVGANPIRSAP